jgi:DNA-binding NarL/FixJ family response regulator
MARGRTNREIAGEVQLSPHTIKDRVGGILRSLDAASRAEAVAIALRQGLIRPVRESSGRV